LLSLESSSIVAILVAVFDDILRREAIDTNVAARDGSLALALALAIALPPANLLPTEDAVRIAFAIFKFGVCVMCDV